MCSQEAHAPNIEALAFTVSAIRQSQENALEHWNGTFAGTNGDRITSQFTYLRYLGSFSRLIQEVQLPDNGTMIVPQGEDTTPMGNSQTMDTTSSQATLQGGFRGITTADMDAMLERKSERNAGTNLPSPPQGPSQPRAPPLSTRVRRTGRQPEPKRARNIPGIGTIDSQERPLPAMVNKLKTTLTLKEIYNLAENGDQAQMKNFGEVFYRTSQFAYESKPEYAWIYLRRRPDGSYPISAARLRIIFPEYKLVEERLRTGSRQIAHLSEHQNRRDGHWAAKPLSARPLQDSLLASPANPLKRVSPNPGDSPRAPQRVRLSLPGNSRRKPLDLREGARRLSLQEGGTVRSRSLLPQPIERPTSLALSSDRQGLWDWDEKVFHRQRKPLSTEIAIEDWPYQGWKLPSLITGSIRVPTEVSYADLQRARLTTSYVIGSRRFLRPSQTPQASRVPATVMQGTDVGNCY